MRRAIKPNQVSVPMFYTTSDHTVIVTKSRKQSKRAAKVAAQKAFGPNLTLVPCDANDCTFACYRDGRRVGQISHSNPDNHTDITSAVMDLATLSAEVERLRTDFHIMQGVISGLIKRMGDSN